MSKNVRTPIKNGGGGIRIPQEYFRKYSREHTPYFLCRSRSCFPADGGGGEIRTHGTFSGTTVFKTAALNLSATPPPYAGIWLFTRLGRCFSFCLLRKTVPSGCLFSLKVFGQRRAGYDGLSLCRKRKSSISRR